ncbi:MAG: tyrosine-type recombinase/integrase [Bacteroidia bacterium]
MSTRTYDHYTKSFKGWLEAIGYSTATTYYSPKILQEFFNWLTENNVHQIEQITAQHTEAFIEYNTIRPKRQGEGSISASHINKYIDIIKKFSEYTRKTQNIEIPINTIRLDDKTRKPRTILTEEEIKILYDATNETPFGIRDRAMLSVYYGCGLRKEEGVQLDLSDILIERKLVYVRKAKNNYERYVPITTGSLKLVEQYIYNARPLLLGDKSSEQALFISERGNRISKERFYQQLQELCRKSGIAKEIGIHSLRHSIATHLLQRGMDLKEIGEFLGHKCLDSTQVYTHLLNEE